ncbi:hypothetical protein SCLCIDRAFT_31448 [Scleroderma citrinum Foug A]|uniref:Uncharacterized protein n=1 Tax=Scleroderma citrinum Foug A TaxID=1036808 RepID=A0A0C2ZMW1_9AGAM|nr:hypothetical protein SCLCIDRAFT_31448 [Scleroderma citrinum Foug A]
MSIKHPYASAPSSYIYANVPYHHYDHTQHKSTPTSVATGSHNTQYYCYRLPASQLHSFVPQSLSSDSSSSQLPAESKGYPAGCSGPNPHPRTPAYNPHPVYLSPNTSPRMILRKRIWLAIKRLGQSLRFRRRLHPLEPPP